MNRLFSFTAVALTAAAMLLTADTSMGGGRHTSRKSQSNNSSNNSSNTSNSNNQGNWSSKRSSNATTMPFNATQSNATQSEGKRTVRDHRKQSSTWSATGNSGTSGTSGASGTVIVRDHRRGKGAKGTSSAAGGTTVTDTPIVKDQSTKTPTWNPTSTADTSSAPGGTTVTDSPIVRDHRDKTPTWNPTSTADTSSAPGGTTVTDSPIVRDHRDEGPIVRDHRDDPSPWNPNGTTVPPTKVPTDPIGPLNPVAEPDPPSNPPTNPPPTNPPTNPPADPPHDHHDDGHHDDHHHGYPWKWWRGGHSGPRRGGPVFVSGPPIVIQQPVVVQPAAAPAAIESEPPLTKVEVGATITLQGKEFGTETGGVGVASGDLMLAATVTDWRNDAVTLTVPELPLAGPAKAKFLIFSPDGTLISEVPFELVPNAKE